MTDFYTSFDGSHDPLKEHGIDTSNFAPRNNWFFSHETKLLYAVAPVVRDAHACRRKGKRLEHDDFWVLRRWNWVSHLHRKFVSWAKLNSDAAYILSHT